MLAVSDTNRYIVMTPPPPPQVSMGLVPVQPDLWSASQGGSRFLLIPWLVNYPAVQ